MDEQGSRAERPAAGRQGGPRLEANGPARQSPARRKRSDVGLGDGRPAPLRPPARLGRVSEVGRQGESSSNPVAPGLAIHACGTYENHSPAFQRQGIQDRSQPIPIEFPPRLSAGPIVSDADQNGFRRGQTAERFRAGYVGENRLKALLRENGPLVRHDEPPRPFPAPHRATAVPPAGPGIHNQR